MHRLNVEFDIGGTWIRAYLWRGSRLVRFERARTPVRSAKNLRAVLVQMYSHITQQSNVNAVYMGVAGKVHGKSVVTSRNIPSLTGFSFAALFPKNISLTVDNDARAFLRGAVMRYPTLRQGIVMGITLGTGVGRAVARGGKVLRLTRLEHSEIWEKKYQKMRLKPSERLAIFISEQIQPLVSQYRPKAIVLGGGVVQNKVGLFKALSAKIRITYGVRILRINTVM